MTRKTLRSSSLLITTLAVAITVSADAAAGETQPQTFQFPGATITVHVDPKQQAQLEQFGRAVIGEMNKVAKGTVLTPTPTPTPPPTPTPTGEGLAQLPVPGFGTAIVSLPLGARSPKPVMVVTHGNNDSPEGHCDKWRGMVQNRGFLLCIRGIRRPGSSDASPTWTHGKEMSSEIEASIVALRSRYGALVDSGPMIYAGFSQGAGMGPTFVMKNASRFTRALMIEGGQGGWAEGTFAKAGGQRVLFACGLANCVSSAEPVAKRFERANVRSKVIFGKGAGHTYGGAVGDEIFANFNWLVEGDARWSPP